MSKEDIDNIMQHCSPCMNYHRCISHCIDSGCEYWAQLTRPKEDTNEERMDMPSPADI